MFGALVLFGIAVYIGIWWFLVTRLKNRWAKVSIVVLALAIPFWDVPIGYYNFVRHCQHDGGVQTFAEIPPQKSLYFASTSGYRPEYLIKAGLVMVEYRKPDGSGILRFVRTPGGSTEMMEANISESPMRIRATFNEKLEWNLFREEQVLEESASGRVLMRARGYTWLGGWLQQQLPLSSAGSCHVSSLNELVALSLKGVKK